MSSSTVSEIPGKGTFRRGVHPPEGKQYAANCPIEIFPPPAQVVLPLLQHTGAPCQPTVKMKDKVALGQQIANADAFVSAPIHASISGVVQKDSVATLPNARHVKTLPIVAEGEQLSGQALWDDLYGGDWSLKDLESGDPKAIVSAVREAGIVGQGGAAFPTHVKLVRNPAKPIDVILINGCECEPYLTADYRLMLEAPQPILAGALLAAHAAGARQIYIAIEDNKPQAIEKLSQAAEGTGVQVAVLHTKYPMGGEKQTILALLGRTVPTGGLPLDVGVVVMNVATAAAVARAVLRGKPLTHRVVTVSGAGIVRPANLLTPIGVSYRELIDHCGGFRSQTARALAGGPMMGQALGDLDAPVTKGTSGITVLTEEDVRAAQETACVRCGRCVDVCPLNLVPTKLALASRAEDWDLCRTYHLMACMECGCCAYVCPAGIPLAQLIRTGKAKLPR